MVAGYAGSLKRRNEPPGTAMVWQQSLAPAAFSSPGTPPHAWSAPGPPLQLFVLTHAFWPPPTGAQEPPVHSASL